MAQSRKQRVVHCSLNMSTLYQDNFLHKVSQLYEATCSQVSRHISAKLQKGQLNTDQSTITKYDSQRCSHCHSLLQPGSCRTKLQPRMRITREIERLRKRREDPRGGFLTAAQQKKLRRWTKSRNVLVIYCNVCKRTNRFPCASRADRPDLPTSSEDTNNSPSVSAKKRKRKSNSSTLSNESDITSSRNFTSPPSKRQKSNLSSAISMGKERTTPTPTKSSGRMNRSAKKNRYRQLQTMLQTAKQEQQASSESPLSKFLTSL